MKSQTKKILLLVIGWFFVLLGMIGIFLPVLPTTPFLLVALWAFSQSSERFHDWLYTHRLFGPPLQDWSKHGVIPLHAKIFAVVTMATSATLVILFTATPWWGIALMLALMLAGAGFVLTRPSRRPAAGED
ncbi:YbaN family protein [Sneathiella sp.]|uniref:YbaN family protein n=1 Tax=Sneathiella sp. TaxID=1964365 RepID=UPI002FE4288B